MTGIITSLPPPIEPPPTNTSGNPEVLGPLSYVPAIPNLTQTWVAAQTFLPGTLVLGGGTGGASQVLKQTVLNGPVTVAQLAFSDISGSIGPIQLPTPTISMLGGVFSKAAVAHNFLTQIGTDGSISQAQPAASDLSNGVTGSGAVVLAAAPTITGNATFTGNILAPSIFGGTSAGSTLTLASTSSGSPSGDATNLYGSTVTIGNALNAPSIINLNGASGGGVTVNIAASGNGLNALNIYNGIGGKQVWVPGAGSGTTPGTITFPAATDQLVCRATTDTLTNKTFDIANNAFRISGTQISASTGTGSFVLSTSPTLVTPLLGTPTSGTLTNCTGLPLSGLANQAAWTFVFNNTSGSAAPTANTIDGLTLKATPAAGDEVIIWDVAGSAIKKATASSLATSSGVSSIAGNTGAFTLSHGLTNSVNDLQIDVSVFRGHLSGLTLSTVGSSTAFSVSVGVAVDSTSTDFMKLASSLSKNTGSWAVGASGSLDTGSIAINTWYHVYLIKRPDTGVVDLAISLSASAPTFGVNIPAAYTLFRRLGSMKLNGSSQWTSFTQLGDEFLWSVPVNDINTSTLGTTSTLFVLGSVPSGVQVRARLRGYMSSATTNARIVISSPDESTQVVATPAGNYTFGAAVGGGAANIFNMPDIRVNTSQQIRAVGDTASTTLILDTYGWFDDRGKLS